MENKFIKEIKKKLIDKEMTWHELASKSGYKSAWGLRQALKRNDERIVEKVKIVLEF